MPTNPFESSQIAEGTMRPNAQHNTTMENESRAISRDDVRDGYADAPPPGNAGEKSEREAGAASPERPRIRRVLAAGTLTGDRVRNTAGEDLGKVDAIMLDLGSG